MTSVVAEGWAPCPDRPTGRADGLKHHSVWVRIPLGAPADPGAGGSGPGPRLPMTERDLRPATRPRRPRVLPLVALGMLLGSLSGCALCGPPRPRRAAGRASTSRRTPRRPRTAAAGPARPGSFRRRRLRLPRGTPGRLARRLGPVPAGPRGRPSRRRAAGWPALLLSVLGELARRPGCGSSTTARPTRPRKPTARLPAGALRRPLGTGPRRLVVPTETACSPTQILGRAGPDTFGSVAGPSASWAARRSSTAPLLTCS